MYLDILNQRSLELIAFGNRMAPKDGKIVVRSMAHAV